VFASIPSPSFNQFEIGPLTIHVYGIFMGIAVATAFIVTVRRYTKYGGDQGVAERAAMWAIIIGFLVARLAYVSTRLDRYGDDWLGIFRIWEGGIAMYGGLTGGTLAAVWMVRRQGGSVPMFADSVALGLPAAQAIGRWGNYFNQELFGTPSNLPWAIEIDPDRRPPEYLEYETFHPTFAYEILWSVGTIAFLLWIERRGFLKRRGSLMFVYLACYGTIRFLLELIRTDTTFRFLGLSRNAWVAALTVIGALIGLALYEGWVGRRRTAEIPPEGGAPADDDAEEAAEEA
jgi:prolipoprotein diacylglyceryl transferase